MRGGLGTASEPCVGAGTLPSRHQSPRLLRIFSHFWYYGCQMHHRHQPPPWIRHSDARLFAPLPALNPSESPEYASRLDNNASSGCTINSDSVASYRLFTWLQADV
jgi:hypothetical protein